MPALTRIVFSIAMFFGITVSAGVPAPPLAHQEATGSISGRATLEGKAVPGVVIALHPIYNPSPQRTVLKQVTTDEDGRFRLTGIAAGRYIVAPFASDFVIPNQTESGPHGKDVMIREGEAIEGLALALVRGGTLTGRVTDAAGQPLAGAYINLTIVTERGPGRNFFAPAPSMVTSDDRGGYRVSGVPPGRYLISAWKKEIGPNSQTYYPGVKNRIEAAIVEIAGGGEPAQVDLKLHLPERTYEISGQVIAAASGRPAPHQQINYEYASSDSKVSWNESHRTGTVRADDQGWFRITGLLPGHYTLRITMPAYQQSESYSEPLVFELTDSDVTGLKIKLHRGASISGVVVVEGTDDPEILAKLSHLEISASVFSLDRNQHSGLIKVGPDGRFKITGLGPGQVVLNFHQSFPSGTPPPASLGFWPLRVERDGIEQSNSVLRRGKGLIGGMEIGPGEQVTGVRFVLAYGTGVVRGQVKIEGGELPRNFQLIVACTQPRGGGSRRVEVDGRGRFVIEGLASGVYELSLMSQSIPQILSGPLSPERLYALKQTISVADGAEISATVVLDLSDKD